MTSMCPPRPHTSEMTFWSRHDPVNFSIPKGNTDHWSKMRLRASSAVPSYQGLSSLGRFERTMTDSFAGNTPGDYYRMTRPKTTSWREKLKSSFNTRAKEGFNYWEIERPKPTKFGRYGIGSYKTVLGVGNGPRT